VENVKTSHRSTNHEIVWVCVQVCCTRTESSCAGKVPPEIATHPFVLSSVAMVRSALSMAATR
jgi:hypothetical protein